jgi:hypothetical protein
MLRGCDKWLAGYLLSVLRRPRAAGGERHLFFCVADHFEPFRGGASAAEARGVVRQWADGYRQAAQGHADSDGRPPRHTFFYPAEEADDECLERLKDLVAEGLGEVEIHLHHRGDTSETLAAKLAEFRDRLHAMGLLGTDAAGRPRYGFVHGNWALCNSRPDGDWCGVNEELAVLTSTGCYADFTFPSAPSPTQPRMVNAIYRAQDRPGMPRGHDRGERLRAGGAEDGLMLVQGPLGLNWSRRKWGVLPRLENAELSGANPPSADRVPLWIRQAVGVQGRPEWVFVKVHTHGCMPANRDVLLGPAMEELRRALENRPGWKLHYVTAREMYNVARAAEKGLTGDPGTARNNEIGCPIACSCPR